jgi:hypothetical protein
MEDNMTLLTIEIPVNDTVAKEYMALPIEKRAGFIKELFKLDELELNDFTTELDGEFPDEEDCETRWYK